MRERLRALSPAFMTEASRRIAAHILHHLEGNVRLNAGCHVALFGGLKNEPDLVSHLLPELDAVGAGACFFHIEQHFLQPRQVHAPDDLQRGHMNVWEPRDHCPALDITALDVVLVPGLAFTRDGVRLGRGGGYYDRLLAHPTFRAQCVAVAFDCQIIDQIPAESHDQRVHQLITESGLIDASSSH
ncbi:MAG: 5-formyltetrahydrofolate cyclo-ligase [Prosthecobacter sp.]|nr:5-formyltetrahydrofolate cyclo-ligase [Prosthecobacter sp.]